MKHPAILMTLVLSAILACAQGDPAGDNTASVPAWMIEFNSLDQSVREQYIKKFSEAEWLFKQKRIIECMRTTEELQKIYDGNPGLLNLQGACHIEIREVDKALACFLKAREIDPSNISIKFNLAETYFIKHDYPKAEEAFLSILKTMPSDSATYVKSLLQFKLYISYLKQNKTDEAKKMESLYGLLDDVPYYYCVLAVKGISSGNTQEGQKAYFSALTIYQDSGMMQAYTDAMQESGLLPSVAGQTYTTP